MPLRSRPAKWRQQKRSVCLIRESQRRVESRFGGGVTILAVKHISVTADLKAPTYLETVDFGYIVVQCRSSVLW